MLMSLSSWLAPLVVVLGGVGAFFLWITKRVIHEELEAFSLQYLQPLKEDVTVLRTAVFNHLTHGERLPDEGALRRKLGMFPRRSNYHAD